MKISHFPAIGSNTWTSQLPSFIQQHKVPSCVCCTWTTSYRISKRRRMGLHLTATYIYIHYHYLVLQVARFTYIRDYTVHQIYCLCTSRPFIFLGELETHRRLFYFYIIAIKGCSSALHVVVAEMFMYNSYTLTRVHFRILILIETTPGP